MIRETIILFTCIGYISCGFFEDAIEIALYKAIRADETNEPHKGVFENCGKQQTVAQCSTEFLEITFDLPQEYYGN